MAAGSLLRSRSARTRAGRSGSGWAGSTLSTPLEIGLGFGISALFICEGLLAGGSEGRHLAIDPYQFDSLPDHRTSYAGVGLQILEEAGVRDIVEFHEEESALVLPRLLAERRRFDSASWTETTASKASSWTCCTRAVC